MSNNNKIFSQSKSRQGQKILASKLIWLALYVVDILIALRIMLKFTSANPESSIISFIGRVHHCFLSHLQD